MPLPTYYRIYEILPAGGYVELFSGYNLDEIRKRLTRYRVAVRNVELHHNVWG